MPLIEVRAPELAGQVVVVGRQKIDAARVVMSGRDRVLHRSLQPRRQPPAPEDLKRVRGLPPGGLDLANLPECRIWSAVVERRQRRVDVPRPEQVHAARPQIIHRDRRALPHDPLETDTILERIGNPHVRREHHDTAYRRVGRFRRERIGIRGIQQDEAHKPILTRAQHFADRSIAGAIVKYAAATPDDRGLADRVRDRQPRRDIIVVAEDILPVVAQPRRD